MHPTPEWLKRIPRLPEFNDNIKLFGGHKQFVNKGWVAEGESHFAFEILYIINGTQKTKLTNRSVILNEGDVVLIPPGLFHQNECISDTGMNYFCIHFFVDNMKVKNKLIINCPLKLDSNNPNFIPIIGILESFMSILDLEDIKLREELLIEKYLWELLIALVDYAGHEEEKNGNSTNSQLLLAKSAAELIENNFIEFSNRPNYSNMSLMSMVDVAESFNISESTLLKTFKTVFLMTPKYYQDQLRYNEARYLLSQPTITIGEISERIGYANVAHFSRQFKKWSGYSPNFYKKMINQI
ncbi:TPA: helix-turn-helix transcriptional regulator [Streptococcus suis]|nr:helix-turn-helix transcriptional regulator [Streptococcus suis]